MPEANPEREASTARAANSTVVKRERLRFTGFSIERSPADRFMRKLLRISDRPEHVSDDQVNRIFETSILISATRCLLAYVVFPIFAPALYAATSWGPMIGLVVGVVALFFDVVSIRRFWKADHRWRWPMTAIYACVITLVTVLLVSDITHLVT